MVSLAITTYNRSGLNIESFINIINNDFIDEIVIVDDCSTPFLYDNFFRIIRQLNHAKIRVRRNNINLGPFRNKIKAVSLCKQPWVIILDSDNIIDNDYIETLKKVDLNEDTLYCPEFLRDVKSGEPLWKYSEFAGIEIDRNNVGNYIEDVNFETSLNTCNNFFNRGRWLEALQLREDSMPEPHGADSTYISYLWLLSGGKIQIVPNLGYRHRVHSDSWYLSHIEEGIKFNSMIYQKIRELKPPIGGFVVNKEFKAMIKTSYDFKEQDYNSDPRWTILERLYVKNYQNAPDYHTNILPKKIHQIWLGGQIPDKYKKFIETWQKLNPDWEYKLWTDEDVKNLNIPNRKLFNSLSNYGPKSDILRYYILNEYGGVYADTDFECLRSFYDFNYLEFFTSIAYQSKLELYPGLIGCIPHHPIMEQIVKDIEKISFIPNDPTGVLESISSYFFTREFWKVVKDGDDRIVAFPPDYFYPFPNQRGHQKRDGHNYIKDCSYTLHHWAVSWMENK